VPPTDRELLAERLCAAGRRLDALGFVPARDGNLSARTAAETLLVTRTGVRKRELTPRDLVEVDPGGRPVAGEGRPTTELGMHLAIYRLRPDVAAVVHAHPPTAVAFACAGEGFAEAFVPEVAVNLGPVPLTPFALPGTPALEAAIGVAAAAHRAFLLANHGAVALGTTIEEALDRMEILEHYARIVLATRILGGHNPLPPGAAAALTGSTENPKG
jgi:L-fuculose-phosphate aldolase